MTSRTAFRLALLVAALICFVGDMAVFSTAATRSLEKPHKVKVSGPIVVRRDNVVDVLDGRDGSPHSFRVTEKTEIRCGKGFLHGSAHMNSASLVPSLTVEVEGVGTSEDVAEAKTIRFSADSFAFVSAEDQPGSELCHKAVPSAGPSHGISAVLSTLLPM